MFLIFSGFVMFESRCDFVDYLFLLRFLMLVFLEDLVRVFDLPLVLYSFIVVLGVFGKFFYFFCVYCAGL